jgi:hypothetical protein
MHCPGIVTVMGPFASMPCFLLSNDCNGTGIAGEGVYDAEQQQYRIVVRRDYKAGDEVFLCYGTYTNLQLLEMYGFLLEHNPHDQIHVALSLWPRDFLDTLSPGKNATDPWLHPGAAPVSSPHDVAPLWCCISVIVDHLPTSYQIVSCPQRQQVHCDHMKAVKALCAALRCRRPAVLAALVQLAVLLCTPHWPGCGKR